MSASLWPFQLDVADDVEAAIAGGRRGPVIRVPTGGGKTHIAAELIRRWVERGLSVLVLVHRRELNQQFGAKLFAAGVDHGVLQADFPTRPGERVQVASVQTLHARAVRSSTIPPPPADIVVIDECHHTPAQSYADILKLYPNALVVGLSATPCRGDGRGLGGVFDVLIEGPSVSDLITEEHLVPARFFAPSRPDLTGIAIEKGDYAKGQLAERMDRRELVGDVVTHWLKLAARRPTIVFASGVGHSLHIRDEFALAGVLAEHVDGSTPTEERDAILRRFAAGQVDVICNAMVLTEGFDAPAASCLVLARPTRSLGLYLQMVGRGLRTAHGKTDCLVLDHAGAVFAHGFPDDPITWSLRQDQRVENKMHTARLAGRSSALAECPKCKAVRFQRQPCPACGWRPRPKAAPVVMAEGELSAVDRSRTASSAQHHEFERRRFQAMLAWIAAEQGYQSGWVAHKFKEKFGDWPPRGNIEPVPPSPEARSWVRSRQIAYAKGRERAGAR